VTGPGRLGDLVRVVQALEPDERDQALIAELLPRYEEEAAGFHRAPPQDAASEAPTAEPTDHLAPPPPRPRPLRSLPAGARRPGRPGFRSEPPPWDRAWWVAVGAVAVLLAGLGALGRIEGVVWLLLVAALVAARPLAERLVRGWWRWWRSSNRHASPEGDEPAEGAEGAAIGTPVMLARAGWHTPPAGPSLVEPSQQRAVATLLAGRPVPGEIDLTATVAHVAARRPLTDVPRQPRWSTSLGVHLHVDVGPALEPFRSDVRRLRRSLVAIASTHGVVELGFDSDPQAFTRPRRIVGPDGPAPLKDRLPPPGTPVLVVTDLGIAVPRSGIPAVPAAFREHHRLVTRAGCPVQYLVPYPPARWPAALHGLPVLHWSDGLGVAEVLAALRRRGRTR
jgi:hypothetical protein